MLVLYDFYLHNVLDFMNQSNLCVSHLLYMYSPSVETGDIEEQLEDVTEDMEFDPQQQSDYSSG